MITGSLEHPNIIPVHDLMSDDDGRLQLVMKRVTGQTWKALLCKPESNLASNLDILVKVCEAVTYAHSRGILHRDLKPENVMVGEHGEVLVMDWGCSVAFGDLPHHPVVPHVTEVDTIAGTPSYMAPEMVLIRKKALGPWSDVYLLGAILYEILTGTRPHRGPNVLAVLRCAAQGKIEHPTSRVPESDLPGELVDICLAALEREPAKRLATADELLQRLLTYRGHAEAIELARSAEQLLVKATGLRSGERGLTLADDLLHQAVGAAENAVQLWRDWPAGQALAARATLAHATHSFATKGFTQAQSLAKRSLLYAADDAKTTAAAKALISKAQAQMHAALRHARNLRFMRWSMSGLATAIVLVCLIAITVVKSEQARTDQARIIAETTLAQLRHEQEQRATDQRRFAPGLVVQAKAALSSEQYAEASDYLAGAVGFDPELIEAVSLHAYVLAADEHYPEALLAAQQWLALRPNDIAGGELLTLLQRSVDQNALVTTANLADLFLRHHLPTLAQRHLRTPEDRLKAYQARLEQAFPGPMPTLKMTASGTVYFEWRESPFKLSTVVDLSPLRGIPFDSLDLSQSGVIDLTPLRGMPLKRLNIDDTNIADLSPLRGCPISEIIAYGCKHLDITSLARLNLQTLNASGNAHINDISVLRGMPLRGVNLSGCQIADLEPLRGMPLEFGSFSGSFRDLSPLAKAPLKELSLSSSAPIDAGDLSGSGIVTLQMHDGSFFSDATQWRRFKPVSLTVGGYRKGRPLDARFLDPSHIEDLHFYAIEAGGIDLKHFSAARPKILRWSYNYDDADLSLFAHPPLASLIIHGNGPAGRIEDTTRKTLAAFRNVATLEEIVKDGGEDPSHRILETIRSTAQPVGQPCAINH